jgi:hypothetical protein
VNKSIIALMKKSATLMCFLGLIAPTSIRGTATAQTPAPSFTISAAPYTMTTNGGAIPFTLTSIHGYTGQLGVTCTNPDPPAGVNEPNCGNYGPATAGYTLAANGTATGTVDIVAIEPLPSPGNAKLGFPKHGNGVGWALAGALMMGLGLRRKNALRRAKLLLSAGLLISLMSISACSGGPATLTPGTYTYTLTASPASGNNQTLTATITVKVTVPPGIDILPGPGPI